MTNLRDLDLDSNKVSDLGPLAGLKNLKKIDLDSNEIRDIGPLVRSELGTGATVELRHNFLDLTPGSAAMKDIEALEKRGVDVSYIPQRR